jgi:F-type H+-transporting ATPase subunit b
MENTEFNKESNINTSHIAEVVHEKDSIGQIIDTVMFSNVLNDLIMFAILIWLIRKYNIFSFISKIRGEIIGIIKDAEKEKTLKKNQLELTKLKVANLPQEINKILKDGANVAGNISKKIIEEASTEAREMENKARIIIENERNIASAEVVKEVTGAAFVMAEENIRRAIDDRMHKKFINEFVESLDSLKVS